MFPCGNQQIMKKGKNIYVFGGIFMRLHLFGLFPFLSKFVKKELNYIFDIKGLLCAINFPMKIQSNLFLWIEVLVTSLKVWEAAELLIILATASGLG